VCKNQKKNLQIVNKIEILFRVEVITQNTEGALDSQPQVIKFTSCLPRVGGSLRVLRLPPPLKTGRRDIAEILLRVALKPNKTINQSKC
jgi:hypothetical protein